MATIVPAILTDDEDVYREQLEKAAHAAKIVQIDIIDGKFANNLTVGTDVIAKYPTTASLELQIMAIDSRGYIEDSAGLEYVTRIIVPFEKNENLKENIYAIKSAKKQVGISINPGTPLAAVADLFDQIDLILFLAVEPGFSGQKFQDVVLEKIKETKKISRGLAVEVDGGINFETAPKAAAAGADFLAANSVIFKAPDFYLAFEQLSKLVGDRRG
ncbi:MAG: ribulose-phosphate 3-epimerase [Candidatus Curtissbacteria bacterium]